MVQERGGWCVLVNLTMKKFHKTGEFLDWLSDH
jgi:hypothetical protein